jgi:hypothetical protein
MRAAQKAYFKDRLRSDLIKCKELEAAVDKAIKEGIVFDLDIVTTVQPTQQNLFTEEGNEQQ